MSEQLNISRNTLRQAINKLVFEGVLVRKKGHGTKVVRKGITGGVKNWLSFSQEMKMLGIEIKNFELHVCFRRLTEETRSFFNENSYNIVVKTSKEEISARLAGEMIAEKLDIAPNDPILIRKRFVYDVNGKPIEYNIGYYRADSFTYTIEAER